MAVGGGRASTHGRGVGARWLRCGRLDPRRHTLVLLQRCQMNELTNGRTNAPSPILTSTSSSLLMNSSA